MARKSNQRTFYESLWTRGWKHSMKSPGASHRTRRRLVLRCFASVYGAGARVLDVGCGNGSLVLAIARRFEDVGTLNGADISESALQQARAIVPSATFFRCDPQQEPFPLSEPVDIVTCSAVLEHVHDYERLIGHMAEALRPGGTAIVAAPHSMAHWGPHDEAVGHLRRFEKEELCAALRAAGLRVEKAFTWGSVLYSLYYRFLLNRVSPATTWKRKSWLVRLVHRALYLCFFIDDLFIDRGVGRMLFVVGRKPAREADGQ